MDIVYLLKESSENPELTCSLRSLKNLPHDNVFFVGGCPDKINLSKISHIPVEQTGTKYKNTTHSLRIVIKKGFLSHDFILMNDDFFIMTPISDPKKELNLNRGLVVDVIKDYQKRYNGQVNPYIDGMVATCQLLEKNGIKNPLSYELHIPMVFNRYKLEEMFSIADKADIPVLHKRTLYGNLYAKDSVFTEDVKMSLHFPELPENPAFLSTSDMYFRKMAPFLNNIFSDKSEYEL